MCRFTAQPFSKDYRFNSYTQQICIDDAVIIDPGRAENVLTNDGSTMRIMVQSMGKPSAWSRQKEIVVDDRDKKLEIIGDEDRSSRESTAAINKSKLIEANITSSGSANPDNPKPSKPASAASDVKVELPKSQQKGGEGSPQGPQDEPQSEEKPHDGDENEDGQHDGSSTAPTPPEDEADGEHEVAPVKIKGVKEVSVSGVSRESA